MKCLDFKKKKNCLYICITTRIAAFAKCLKHSAKALPSVALGKEGSAHSASAKPSLPSTFSRALGSVREHSAKKSSRYGDG